MRTLQNQNAHVILRYEDETAPIKHLRLDQVAKQELGLYMQLIRRPDQRGLASAGRRCQTVPRLAECHYGKGSGSRTECGGVGPPALSRDSHILRGAQETACCVPIPFYT